MLPGVRFLQEPANSFSNRWLTTILVDPVKIQGAREHIRLSLERENIDSRPLWKPMHLQPVFHDCPFYGNGTSEKLFEIGLCLPSGSNLSVEDIDAVAKNVARSIGAGAG